MSDDLLTASQSETSKIRTPRVRGLRPFVSSDLPLAVPNEIKVDGKAVKCGDYKFVQGKVR